MEIPFLKNKNRDGGGGPIERVAASTHPDRNRMDDTQEMLSQVWDELFHSFEVKDKKLGMEALSALVLHIQDADQAQDEEDSV